MKQRFSEEQIVQILREAAAAPSKAEVCRKHGISEWTYYRWRRRYDGMADDVVPAADLPARTDARTLGLLANAPQSMAWIKRVAAFAVRYPDPAPSAFDALGMGVFETRDCDEGVTAFLAGRPARFTGH